MKEYFLIAFKFLKVCSINLMPFAYKMPTDLSSSDTSPGWKQKGQKIILTGIVYKRDGKTPASNVIIYYYHTDIHGIYSTNTNEPLNMPKNKLGQTHGYIRGWLKTEKDGESQLHIYKLEIRQI